MNRVAIYCGSSKGFSKTYEQGVKKLAKELVRQRIKVVYGAGSVGLMGVLADEVLKSGGEIFGVIPQFLMDMEVGHEELTSLEVVEDMHIRKKRMVDMSEGFIAMPGGFGTLDEVFEVLTWEQLSLHTFPVGFYNVNGYYDHLKTFLEHTVKEGFIKSRYLENIVFADDPVTLIDLMEAKSRSRQVGKEGKWIN